MKLMKQCFAVLLILLMLVLCSCDSSDKTSKENSEKQTTKVEQVTSEKEPIKAAGNSDITELDDMPGKGEHTEESKAELIIEEPTVTTKVASGNNESATTNKVASDKKEPEKSSKVNSDTEKTSTPKDVSERLKWEEFYALSAAEKDAYLNSFGDYELFYEWMFAAREQFKIDYPDIGTDGAIDLSKLK